MARRRRKSGRGDDGAMGGGYAGGGGGQPRGGQQRGGRYDAPSYGNGGGFGGVGRGPAAAVMAPNPPQARGPVQPQQQQGGGGGGGAPVNVIEGILQMKEERGDGQLRDLKHPLRQVGGGIFVSRQMIRDLRLRPGLVLKGSYKGNHLTRLLEIEGLPVDDYLDRPSIYDSTPVDPYPMLKLEHETEEYTTRVIDMLTPIGFGQRGLIVAPPRAGKTILLQNVAKGIHKNHPEAELMLLLVDERPEEVTDMRRNIPGTVYASSNDNDIDMHLDLAQLVIERAKRRVEYGKDVVVLLDSLTRLGRAFNAGGVQGGRTMSGGLDNRALEVPKKLFGAARKIENGGSLTIIATCLIDTGSRMDQIIFEEFKGTGNMELTLDRGLSNMRIFPAINILQSGTRKEEKLMEPRALAASRNIRRHILNMNPVQGMKSLLDLMKKVPSNKGIFDSVSV
ncbi:MAG TPA: transcription termination factor Rho [Tepidisphaeraceae bacterium]|nr:transcription termination factor Rho [Tepidisphaeraceae bacterium]